ncbi:DPP IV N-terminal domain-containing protein [Planctomicrobium sp. SH668]|uniref:S9 family peptidase n=1 Tax=Planctomicrobium sp. SH668 TaxID=3448126 RepID=UPI003F5B92ED
MIIGHQLLASPPETWPEYEKRLRDIYQGNEFREEQYEAKWSRDSQQLVIRRPASSPEISVMQLVDGEWANTEGPPADLEATNGEYTLFIKDGSLWAKNRSTQREHQIVKNDRPDNIHLHSLELSPDGKFVSFVETDYLHVPLRTTLEKSDPTYPKVKSVPYSRIGERLPDLRVGVVDIEGKHVRWLPLAVPPEGFHLGLVNWADNSEEVFIEKLSRYRDRREFLLANTKNGQIRCIFEETDPAWVVASIQVNMGIQWVDKGSKFVVIHENSGWRQAYLYARTGELIRPITPDGIDIIERCCIDEERDWYYYYASPENGTQKYLYRAPLTKAGEVARVTPIGQAGTHDFVFSPDRKWALHTFSSFDVPPVTDLIEASSHRSIQVLVKNDRLKEKAQDFQTLPTEFKRIDIGEGIEMDAWMVKPANFDSTMKYPVFVYVYGEPHAQTVIDKWGAAQSLFNKAVAELGYIVVSIDNRGTPCPKGAAWRRSIFGSLGPLSTEEQAAGLIELAKQNPYIDLNRVGIWGWSGGGSNTLNALFRKPELYKVGIAVVPKPQPHLYNAYFQEIYMRDPVVNPEGYRKSAPINFAEGLKGDLLILHGGGENNTHIQIVEGLVDRLIELGKPFDYMVYPHRDHGLREGPGSLVHVRMQIARYLVKHLQPGPLPQ